MEGYYEDEIPQIGQPTEPSGYAALQGRLEHMREEKIRRGEETAFLDGAIAVCEWTALGGPNAAVFDFLAENGLS